MLRAISAVEVFDARHIEFNGNESASSNSDEDEDEAVYLETCCLSQVLRWEDLAEQPKQVIGKVFLLYKQPLVSAECPVHLCQHDGGLLLWLQHFTFLYAAPRLCWELNPVGTFLRPKVRRGTELTMVVAAAVAEDQTAPTPQKG